MADIVNIYNTHVYHHNKRKQGENLTYVTHEI